jgi:hypothetical protein
VSAQTTTFQRGRSPCVIWSVCPSRLPNKYYFKGVLRVMFVFVIIFPDDERTPHHDGDIAKGDYPRDRIDMS